MYYKFSCSQNWMQRVRSYAFPFGNWGWLGQHFAAPCLVLMVCNVHSGLHSTFLPPPQLLRRLPFYKACKEYLLNSCLFKPVSLNIRWISFAFYLLVFMTNFFFFKQPKKVIIFICFLHHENFFFFLGKCFLSQGISEK